MERFNALGRGAQLMLVGAVLLFIDLLLPWQDFTAVSFSGWRGVGVILGLLTIVLLAWLIVRLASVNIPLPVSTAMTAALIGTLILIFAVIKLLTILGDEATLWAWVGLALAIVIAVGAFQTVQEAGGVENLRSEASSLGAGSSATPAATTDVPPPAVPIPPAAPEPMTPIPDEPAAHASPAAEMDAAAEAAPDEAEAASDAAGDEIDEPSSERGA